MRYACLLTLSATLAGAAHGAQLTYQAALQLADQTAPNLLARAADVRVARSSEIAAGRLLDPKLAFGVEEFQVSRPTAGRSWRDDFSDVRVGLMQDLPNGAKRRSARERADAARDVQLNTALAWIDLYYTERRSAALDEIDQALAPMRNTASSQVASGALRPAQTLAPEQLTAMLGDQRADLTAAVARARAELVRWTDDT
jgi:cobalt-zinc-cadmium efflux system outer membrane protein